MTGRVDLGVHRWVLEQSLLQARKYAQPAEAARVRRLLVILDRRRLARQ